VKKLQQPVALAIIALLNGILQPATLVSRTVSSTGAIEEDLTQPRSNQKRDWSSGALSVEDSLLLSSQGRYGGIEWCGVQTISPADTQ
jgi:hypothetical protein